MLDYSKPNKLQIVMLIPLKLKIENFYFVLYRSLQLRARPEYREPRPQFEAKELAQPIRRPQNEFIQAKPRPHHDNDVCFMLTKII